MENGGRGRTEGTERRWFRCGAPCGTLPRRGSSPFFRSPFISPRESNRAIDATAIIRNRPRRVVVSQETMHRVFHLLVSFRDPVILLSLPSSPINRQSRMYTRMENSLISNWYRNLDVYGNNKVGTIFLLVWIEQFCDMRKEISKNLQETSKISFEVNV